MFTIHLTQQSTGVLPEPKLPRKLVVLCAFDLDEEGVLEPAFEPREMPDERRAVTLARELSHRHVGVITWSREAPSVLFRSGQVPEMD